MGIKSNTRRTSAIIISSVFFMGSLGLAQPVASANPGFTQPQVAMQSGAVFSIASDTSSARKMAEGKLTTTVKGGTSSERSKVSSAVRKYHTATGTEVKIVKGLGHWGITSGKDDKVITVSYKGKSYTFRLQVTKMEIRESVVTGYSSRFNYVLAHESMHTRQVRNTTSWDKMFSLANKVYHTKGTSGVEKQADCMTLMSGVPMISGSYMYRKSFTTAQKNDAKALLAATK